MKLPRYLLYYKNLMISQVFIEEKGNGRLGIEENCLFVTLKKRGIPVSLFTQKRIFRRQLPLSLDTLVVGSIPVMHQVFKQLDIDCNYSNYPECLEHLLYRRLWKSTVGQVINDISNGEQPIFVKPADRLKRFTGFVLDSPYETWKFQGASHRIEVICSDIVKWQSEYRVYVTHNHVVGIEHYDGDPSILPDCTVIESAVQILKESGTASAGYGIDFGVLGSGQTALIEFGDGYSLGCYNLHAELYTNLIIARWTQLMESKRKSTKIEPNK